MTSTIIEEADLEEETQEVIWLFFIYRVFPYLSFSCDGLGFIEYACNQALVYSTPVSKKQKG
jgi:hypothetical protein